MLCPSQTSHDIVGQIPLSAQPSQVLVRNLVAIDLGHGGFPLAPGAEKRHHPVQHVSLAELENENEHAHDGEGSEQRLLIAAKRLKRVKSHRASFALGRASAGNFELASRAASTARC